MRSFSFLRRNWRLLLAALTAAGIVHICTTLAAVHTGDAPGYTQLAAELPINQISYLPEVTPQNQRVPFMMPDTRYAVCLFDASEGVIRIRAAIPAPGWSLSMHTPTGDNILFVPGTAERITQLDIAINPGGQIFDTKSITQINQKKESPVISVKKRRGIAIYRSPVNALAFRRIADEQLNAFECYRERKG